MLEFHLPDEYSDLQRPRIFNSHFTPKCLPKQAFEKKCNMIIIERNPKDILTSQYHHWNLFPQFSLSWSDFLKSVYTNDRNVSSNWFFYQNKWSDFLSSSDNPCLVLKYEDIKQNTLASLFKLADFLGYPREETFLKEIQEKCSLDKMRDMEKLRESGTEIVNSDQVSKLYRKGVVGDWKNNFTVAQNEQFEALLKTKLNGVDLMQIKRDWPRSSFVDVLRNKLERSSLCKLRLSAHNLAIEKGRHLGLPTNERVCNVCKSGEVEDENHFLLFSQV
ncbi:unnamed protein product [Mytilus coruscus]|uniref:Sulfotransferase domain-containing protein n=1 Tax=Mytilus coruscus TaxID=42192 RepID=A0A6J8BZK6_MYTCO|nr:unnamed protein product [Mytilus coruscus]